MLTAQADLVPIPQYTAAIPFVGTAVLLLVAQVAGKYVASRFEKDLNTFFSEAQQSGAITKTVVHEDLAPSVLRQRFEWSVDAIVAATAIIAPAFGLALLPINFEGHFGEILLGVGAATLVLFLLTLGADPGKYAGWSLIRGKRWALSPVTWIGVLINLVCGVIAVLLSAQTYVSTIPHG